MVCALLVAGPYVAVRLFLPVGRVAVRSQLGALKVPLPGGRLVTPKVTVPLGLVASAGTVTVSWTVAVQVLVPPVGTRAGEHTSEVLARWRLAGRPLVSHKPEGGASPPQG